MTRLRAPTAAKLAWSAWVMLALATVLSFVFLWLSRDVALPDVTPLRGFEGILGMTAATAGLPVAARRPHHPIGWLFLALGASWVLPSLALQYAYLALLGTGAPLPAGGTMAWVQDVVQYTMSAPIFALVMLLFPTGRLVSRRWRILAVLAVVSGPLEGFGAAVRPGPIFRFQTLENPYALTGFVQDVAAVVAVVGNLFFIVGILGGVAALIVRFRRAKGDERQQLKWIATSAAFVGVGMAAYIAIGQDSSTSPWARPVFIFLFLALTAVPVTAAIAILRFRLYDIDRIISRTVAYALVVGTLGAIYLGLVVALQQLSRPVTGSSDLAVAASTLIAAAGFFPLRRRIQDVVDRRFNRAHYDAARTVEAFTLRLRQELDLDTLKAELCEVVQHTMEPQTVGPVADLAPDDPLLAYFLSSPCPVDVDRLRLESPGLEAMRASGVKLAVPLVSQGELIGMLSLGPRLSEQEYSADDRKLLDNLASRAAPALRVAQLVGEQEAQARARERYEQELRIAQLIQHNYLPRIPPELNGWRLDAVYRPAREVGGDFYDFLELPGDAIGIVIGDVTDKGVPAALVMASARGAIRSVAARSFRPGEVLEDVNELLCPEMPPKMFVTCLYAVLDPRSGSMVYANAGHNLPYRHRTDGVEELRACGMPLGLLPGSTYEEREVTIGPGESVLFSSDGIAEAHDPSGEIFGCPRLVEVVASDRPGQDLRDIVLHALHAFTGSDWEQEDDITMVTVERTDQPTARPSSSPSTTA